MVKYTYVLFNLSLFIKYNCIPKGLNSNYKIQYKYYTMESMIHQKRQQKIKINNSSCITQEQKVCGEVGSTFLSDQEYLAKQTKNCTSLSDDNIIAI